MKMAKDIYKGIIENYELIDKQLKELSSMQSMLDRELARTYHEIEITRFNASQGYNYAKKIQEICQQRRIVKKEMSLLQSIKANLPFIPLADKATYKKRKATIEGQFTYHSTDDSYYNNFKTTSIEDIAI